MEFWKKKLSNPHKVWPRNFITQFRETFIFGASQSELSIKSYGHLKFFRPKTFEILNL